MWYTDDNNHETLSHQRLTKSDFGQNNPAQCKHKLHIAKMTSNFT